MPASEEQWAAASLLNVVSLGLFWANNLYPNLPPPTELSTDIYIHFYSTMIVDMEGGGVLDIFLKPVNGGAGHFSKK